MRKMNKKHHAYDYSLEKFSKNSPRGYFEELRDENKKINKINPLPHRANGQLEKEEGAAWST